MRRLVALIVVPLCWLCVSAQRPAQSPPVFRGGTDVLQLDVSVLDKQRLPVRGLAESDFTLLIDGKPQPIVAFAPFDLPDAVKPTATWTSAVTPDVTTNSLEGRRLVVLVLDDGAMHCDRPGPGVPYCTRTTKQIATQIVQRLGPADLAAVVFTGDNRNSQDFTSDKAKLFSAINTFSPGFVGMSPLPGGAPNQRGLLPAPPDQLYYRMTLGTLTEVARFLIDTPDQRKALVYISTGIPLKFEKAAESFMGAGTGEQEMAQALLGKTLQLFQQAQQANVNVYPFDLNGVSGAPDRTDFMLTLASNTGGHAAVHTTDFVPGINQMLLENGSFYLLGYRSAGKADGSVHRVEVKVNRPNVEVRARRYYYTPAMPSPSSVAAEDVSTGMTVRKALAGVLPKTDLALSATLAPYAIAAEGASARSAVAVVVNVQVPDQTQSIGESLDLLATAFDPEGRREWASARQTARVMLRPDSSNSASYEVLARLDLPPGRYRVRIGAHSTALNKDGSVYADVIVPDFAKSPLSMSGIAIEARPGRTTSSSSPLSAVLAIVPTAQRDFDVTSRATALFRIYQGGKSPVAPVTLKTTLIDDHDRSVLETIAAIPREDFGVARAAEQKYELPIAKLAPGTYLLRFEATIGKTSARRDVVFRVH